MNKCDSCGKFGELEEITVTIKKHKNCDINGAFGVKEEVKIPVNLPVMPPNSVAPYVNSELEKMIIK